jgi:hypothetical protein
MLYLPSRLLKRLGQLRASGIRGRTPSFS